MKLKSYEALAVRWHMMWSYDPPTKLEINGALSKNRLVLLTATADHLASIMYEKSEGSSYEPMALTFSEEER